MMSLSEIVAEIGRETKLKTHSSLLAVFTLEN